jgi:hypothetical protein
MGSLQILGAGLLVAIAFATWKFAKFLYAGWASPLRTLPGPPNSSLLYGNMKQIWDAVRDPLSGHPLNMLMYKQEPMELYEKWAEEYGSTLKYKAFLGVSSRFLVCRSFEREDLH